MKVRREGESQDGRRKPGRKEKARKEKRKLRKGVWEKVGRMCAMKRPKEHLDRSLGK